MVVLSRCERAGPVAASRLSEAAGVLTKNSRLRRRVRAIRQTRPAAALHGKGMTRDAQADVPSSWACGARDSWAGGRKGLGSDEEHQVGCWHLHGSDGAADRQGDELHDVRR